MKRVLLDENLPRRLRHELPQYEIRTVQDEGWGSLKNGELLRKAEGEFDVLVTGDRRMQFQQNLSSYRIGVIVTPRLRFQVIRSVIESVGAAIANVRPGQVIHISV